MPSFYLYCQKFLVSQESSELGRRNFLVKAGFESATWSLSAAKQTSHLHILRQERNPSYDKRILVRYIFKTDNPTAFPLLKTSYDKFILPINTKRISFIISSSQCQMSASVSELRLSQIFITYIKYGILHPIFQRSSYKAFILICCSERNKMVVLPLSPFMKYGMSFIGCTFHSYMAEKLS